MAVLQSWIRYASHLAECLIHTINTTKEGTLQSYFIRHDMYMHLTLHALHHQAACQQYPVEAADICCVTNSILRQKRSTADALLPSCSSKYAKPCTPCCCAWHQKHTCSIPAGMIDARTLLMVTATMYCAFHWVLGGPPC